MENHLTAERIANLLMAESIEFIQKRMFGGDCFMVDDKMLMGTYRGSIMARVDPSELTTLEKRPGVAAMVHGGRSMPGYLMIESSVYEQDADLLFWVRKCMEFNPKAQSSKKKKK